MGYWKDFQEKIGGGVHEPYQLDYVCACCFGDSALKYCVEANAARKVCTFCDAQEDDLISAPFLDVIGYISECLAREYDTAENCLPYESAEGGYQGTVWTTYELLIDQLELGSGLITATREAAKHALDDGALPVDGLVIMVLDLAVLARWDDGRGSAFCQPVAQGFAVIALVGDEFGGGRHGFDTALGDLAIMDVSWCQEQDEGPAFRIADSVELGVAAPLGAADAMGQGPPFPPPAQR